MTIDRWLTVGLIFSGVVGPTLAVFIQFRISQPKQAENPRLKTSTQNENGLFRKYRVVTISILFILYDIYLLVSEVHKTTPITRGSILLISTVVAAISFNLLSLGAIFVLANIAYPLLNLSKEITAIVKGILGITDSHEERVYKLEIANFDRSTREYLTAPPEHPKSRSTDI